jgi:hypothetical protein
MNRQSQWLFEAPPVSEATYYTNPHANPEYYNPELEFEFSQSYCPPAQSSETISGFEAHKTSIPPGEQNKIYRIARNILGHFLPGCRPDRIVRLCLIGHADKDLQRGRDFEARISIARVFEVDKALDKAIVHLFKSDPKFKAIRGIEVDILRIARAAEGSIVQNPKNEQERKQNRRVEIFLKSISRNDNCCGTSRSLAQSKKIYASNLRR